MPDEKKDALSKPIGSLFKAKKVGVAARLEAAKASMNQKPDAMKDRIGIVFDDSGSMYGEKLNKAKEAFSEFTRVCVPGQTALAVNLLHDEGKTDKPLTADLITLDMWIQGIPAPNGTPLWGSMDRLVNNVNITRAIVFSDGGPTDGSIPTKEGQAAKTSGWGYTNDGGALASKVIALYKEKNLVVDTVFLGYEGDVVGMATMKWIAEQTGGVFLHFTEPGLFAKNFKYLAPAFRYMLADKSFVEEIQKK